MVLEVSSLPGCAASAARPRCAAALISHPTPPAVGIPVGRVIPLLCCNQESASSSDWRQQPSLTYSRSSTRMSSRILQVSPRILPHTECTRSKCTYVHIPCASAKIDKHPPGRAAFHAVLRWSQLPQPESPPRKYTRPIGLARYTARTRLFHAREPQESVARYMPVSTCYLQK